MVFLTMIQVSTSSIVSIDGSCDAGIGDHGLHSSLKTGLFWPLPASQPSVLFMNRVPGFTFKEIVRRSFVLKQIYVSHFIGVACARYLKCLKIKITITKLRFYCNLVLVTFGGAKGSHHGRKAAYLRTLSGRGGDDQLCIFWGDFVIYMEILERIYLVLKNMKKKKIMASYPT